MHQHKYFNLRLHENVELEEILRTKIVERKTLHEWPLSCVEQIITNEGRKWVYKSHLGLFYGIPSTGKQIEINGFGIYYLENGQIIADSVCMDWMEAVEQLGGTISAASTGST